MLPEADTYEQLYAEFEWCIPDRYNMGVDVSDKHAVKIPDNPALIIVGPDGQGRTVTFLELSRLTNQLANVFKGIGARFGDRVAVLLPQSLECATAHIAAWKAGLISIPLFTLFGEDALQFRLANSTTRVLVTDQANLVKVLAIRDNLPWLETILVIDQETDSPEAKSFWRAVEAASDTFQAVDTRAEDPAVIIYTSGTTGNPKGALHAHRVLLGHLPGVEMFQDYLPQPGDRMWTPADWAWIGGLMNCLMAALHHGVPVVAHRFEKFSSDAALDLMARFDVRNTFLPPTALRLMAASGTPIKRPGLSVRSIGSAGEPVGADLIEWGRDQFGLTINEFYGQTECNLIVSCAATLMPAKPGSLGRQAVGHRVAVIDEDGRPLPPGEEGELACHAPDPSLHLGYWKNEAATRANFSGPWWRMGDRGWQDEDGYLWFKGRSDDVITSAGYRIGPGEIEDCLASHPAVTMAAVIGVPDKVRTEVIKAFVQLAPGHVGDTALEAAIQDHVKARLSPHEYPRIIEFVENLPLTATGKVRRKELRDQARADQDGSEA